MGIGSIGIPSLILIIVLALLIFGPNKLPEIGKAAGNTLREFKNSANDLMSDAESEKNEENEKTKETEEINEDAEKKDADSNQEKNTKNN